MLRRKLNGTRLFLRRGLRFSDGHPCTADDVLFSFTVYLDERVHSPQRDLLMVGGVPLGVRKIDDLTVAFDLPSPYAAGERLFDSVAILPRHLLEAAYREGTIARAWGLSADPSAIAGLGPFRLSRYVPGERSIFYGVDDEDADECPGADRQHRFADARPHASGTSVPLIEETHALGTSGHAVHAPWVTVTRPPPGNDQVKTLR